MARAVGLDIGAHHVRLVEAEGGPRALSVLRLGERGIAAAEGVPRDDAVRDAVDALFRDTRASRDEVVLAWPAEACVLRELTLPYKDPDQLRKVLKFEFESHLHGRDIEDVVVDFIPTGETKEGSRILCVGADKGPLRSLLKALEQVKVDPVAVDLDVMVIVAGLAGAGVLLETPTAVIADIGTRSTKITLVVDGKIRSIRAFRGGTESLAPGIGREGGDGTGAGGGGGVAALALPPGARPDDLLALPGAAAATDAPPAELSAGALEGAVALDRRGEYLGRLSREMTRTLAQAGPGTTFPVLHITGRGSQLPGIRESLAAHLAMEIRPLDLLSRVKSPVPPDRMEEANTSYAAAFGAAARALGAAPSSVDLRREDLSYARRFDQVKGVVAVGLGFLLLGVGFLLWRAKVEKEVALSELSTIVGTVRGTAERVEATYKTDLGDEVFNKLPKGSSDPLSVNALQDYNRRVTQMHTHLRDDLGQSTEVPPILSSLEAFRGVHSGLSSIREQLEYCLVNSENYTQKGAEITLVLSAPEHADTVKAALEAVKRKDGSKMFNGGVVPGTIKIDNKQKYPVTFTLTFEKR